MHTLRDFVFLHDPLLVRTAVARFEVPPILEEHDIALLRFEMITPDSFMWRLALDNGVYYLYAEDYIPSLRYVQDIFSRYTESTSWEFVPPRQRLVFSASTPVRNATVYNEPEDADSITAVAIDSGPDFVFLARTAEDCGTASFSESAPRGFTQ